MFYISEFTIHLHQEKNYSQKLYVKKTSGLILFEIPHSKSTKIHKNQENILKNLIRWQTILNKNIKNFNFGFIFFIIFKEYENDNMQTVSYLMVSREA